MVKILYAVAEDSRSALTSPRSVSDRYVIADIERSEYGSDDNRLRVFMIDENRTISIAVEDREWVLDVSVEVPSLSHDERMKIARYLMGSMLKATRGVF